MSHQSTPPPHRPPPLHKLPPGAPARTRAQAERPAHAAPPTPALPFKALHTLVVIGTKGSHGAAARHLGVTVSAVSHQLRQLEAWLGQPVLERTTRAITPTPAGRALIEGMTAPFNTISKVAEDVRRHARRARVVISAPPGFASVRLVPALAQRDPNGAATDVDLRFAAFDAAPDHGAADISIRFLHAHATGARIGQRGWSAVSTPTYARTHANSAGRLGGSRREMSESGETAQATSAAAGCAGTHAGIGAIASGILLHETIHNFWPEAFAAAGLGVPAGVTFQPAGDAHHVLSTLLAGHGLALLPNELTAGLRASGALHKWCNVDVEVDAGYFALASPAGAARDHIQQVMQWLEHEWVT